MNKKPVRTSQKLEKLIWEQVVRKFAKADSQEEVHDLFLGLMTVQERGSVARRLAVLSLLKRGARYRDIGEQLWVSPVTISTIKKSLLGRSYRSYYEMKGSKPPVWSNMTEAAKPAKGSAFSDWLDEVAFMLENAPQISGARWRFLTYNRTLPKKYRGKKK